MEEKPSVENANSTKMSPDSDDSSTNYPLVGGSPSTVGEKKPSEPSVENANSTKMSPDSDDSPTTDSIVGVSAAAYDELPSTSQPQNLLQLLPGEGEREPPLRAAPWYTQSYSTEQPYLGNNRSRDYQYYSLQQQNLLQPLPGEGEREPPLRAAPWYTQSYSTEQLYLGPNYSLQQPYTCQQPLSEQLSTYSDNQCFDWYTLSPEWNQQQPLSAMRDNSGFSPRKKEIPGKGRKFPFVGTMSGKNNSSPSQPKFGEAYFSRKKEKECLDVVEEFTVKLVETLRNPEEKEEPTLSQYDPGRDQSKSFSQLDTRSFFKNSENVETFNEERFGCRYNYYSKATNGFQERLGEGGEGEVFKGMVICLCD